MTPAATYGDALRHRPEQRVTFFVTPSRRIAAAFGQELALAARSGLLSAWHNGC